MFFFLSIPTWGWFDILFNFAVLVALCGESHWALKWLIPNSSEGKTSVKWRREKLKKKFEFLLIIGIAGEVGCLPFSLYESANANKAAGVAMQYAANSSSNSVQVLTQVAQLNKEAADARKDAGDAMKSAAKLDVARAEAEQETALIRSNNLELQLQLQPRIISMEQITNFINLTDKIPKFPIRVGIGASHDETFSYAWQIRQMLDKAGYVTPDSDTNFTLGIHIDETAFSFATKIGDTNVWNDVMFCTDNTNDFTVFHYSTMQKTNGFVRYTISTGNTNDVYGAIIKSFSQIGIKIGWKYKPDWVSPNHCEIFVIQKPQ